MSSSHLRANRLTINSEGSKAKELGERLDRLDKKLSAWPTIKNPSDHLKTHSKSAKKAMLRKFERKLNWSNMKNRAKSPRLLEKQVTPTSYQRRMN